MEYFAGLKLGKEVFSDPCSYELYVFFCCVELTPKVYTDLSDTFCIVHSRYVCSGIEF
jgi:hypothetical protein